jgi:hypothetical protein
VRLVSGRVVDSDGQPVADATVTPVAGGNATPADVSDGAGGYAFPIKPGATGVIEVKVEREGFEPSLVFISLDAPGDVTRTLRLHRIMRVPAGNAVQLPIDQGDPVCSDGQSYWPCRRIRVVPASTGLVTVSAEGTDVPLRLQLAGNPRTGGRVVSEQPVVELVTDVLLLDRSGRFLAELATWSGTNCGFYYYYC